MCPPDALVACVHSQLTLDPNWQKDKLGYEIAGHNFFAQGNDRPRLNYKKPYNRLKNLLCTEVEQEILYKTETSDEGTKACVLYCYYFA